MKKKLVVAVATSLIIANGSSVALASAGSDGGSTTSTTSTTVARAQNNPNLTAAQRAAQQAAQRAKQQAQNEVIARYKVELAKYLQTRQAINTAFSTAMVNAQRDFKVARESATNQRAINIATRARLEAVQAATRTKNAALRALGAPPVKPVRP